MKTACKYCGTPITGRSDKLFCDPHCKGLYHYQANKEKEVSFFKQIDDQLRKNRRILKAYNKGGKVSVRKDQLLREGFHPRIFTHYWKATNGNTYLFVYEYGFMSITENGKQKFVLVQWQDYMHLPKP